MLDLIGTKEFFSGGLISKGASSPEINTYLEIKVIFQKPGKEYQRVPGLNGYFSLN